MSEDNFLCPDTGKRFKIPRYSTFFDASGKQIYKDKSGNIIVNPDNGTPLVFIEKEQEGDIELPYFGKFASGSPAAKKEMLQKRSWKHANSPEMKDRRAEVTEKQKPKMS